MTDHPGRYLRSRFLMQQQQQQPIEHTSPLSSYQGGVARVARPATFHRYSALRVKTTFIILLTLVGLLVAQSIPLQTVLLGSFVNLEEQTVRTNLHRAGDALSAKLADMSKMNGDWAAWDDMYDFVVSHDAKYIESDLGDVSILNIHLNLLLLFDNSGHLVFGKAFDLQNQQEIPVPEQFLHLNSHDLLMLGSTAGNTNAGDGNNNNSGINSGVAGVVLTPAGPMMVTSRPILTSEKEGPVRGTMIMGRYLDATEIADLSNTTHLLISVGSLDERETPSDVAQARNALLAGAVDYIAPLDEQTIAGYSLLNSIYGKPVLMMRVQSARDIYAQGKASTWYFGFSLVAAGLVFALVILVLLDRVVLARLAYLGRQVAGIGTGGDLSARVQAKGKDELSDLAGDINQMLTALERSQHEREESEARYRAVVEQATEAILLVDRDTRNVLEANPAACELLHCTSDEVLSLSLNDIIPHAGQTDPDIRRTLTEKRAFNGERKWRRPDGSSVEVEMNSSMVAQGGKEVLCLVAHDITERKRMEEDRARREAEERFRALVQNSADLISILDLDGTIRYQSPSVERVLGYDPDFMVGKNILSLLHSEDQPAGERLLSETFRKPGENISAQLRAQHQDGSWLVLEVICSNLLSNPNVRGILLNTRDITERKALEEQLEHQAFHDPLTGLPNRALFADRLHHAVARAQRSGRGVAVMFLDLDNFKLINDSLGHRAGDQLLNEVGKRLQQCLRLGDTVARQGGDEFTILLEDIGDVTDVSSLAERIAQKLQAHFTIEGREIFLTTSIGIALRTSNTTHLDDLLRRADLALYEAKRSGKACFRVFDPNLDAQAWARLRLETDLRRAIDNGEFLVYYQPIIDLGSERVTGVEALIRWKHPERGLVSPGEFIPVAEELGLILPIGRWVLAEACRQVAEWQRERPSGSPLLLSVNLSARQFRHPNLLSEISEILDETGLAAQSLKLEITESVAMEDPETAVTTLLELKALGIRIAIDDFGTGYSTLSTLKRCPVDTLKIDRSFVSGLGHDPEDMAIVRAAIAFGKALGLDVTGEGVETAEQLGHLRALGCDRGQGYYFSRPVPSEVAASLVLKEYKEDMDIALTEAVVPGWTHGPHVHLQFAHQVFCPAPTPARASADSGQILCTGCPSRGPDEGGPHLALT